MKRMKKISQNISNLKLLILILVLISIFEIAIKTPLTKRVKDEVSMLTGIGLYL